jgi:hypothetical protein
LLLPIRGSSTRIWTGDANRFLVFGGQTGSTNSGRLFRSLPTSRLTGHPFISSAGYGLSKSTGGCDGSPGCNHRS